MTGFQLHIYTFWIQTEWVLWNEVDVWKKDGGRKKFNTGHFPKIKLFVFSKGNKTTTAKICL